MLFIENNNNKESNDKKQCKSSANYRVIDLVISEKTTMLLICQWNDDIFEWKVGHLGIENECNEESLKTFKTDYSSGYSN